MKQKEMKKAEKYEHELYLFMIDMKDIYNKVKPGTIPREAISLLESIPGWTWGYEEHGGFAACHR